MTPLAAYLANQVVARQKHREHIWVEPKNVEQLRDALFDCHFFEVTQCLPIVKEIAGALANRPENEADEIYGTYSFLPAPKTWIEWKHGSGNRIAVLLEQLPIHDKSVRATMYCDRIATNLGQISLVSGDIFDNGGKRYFPDWLIIHDAKIPPSLALLSMVHTSLVLINTPKIIGRQQHMPNRGLERRLTRGLGAGKFPLHAWTEIKLHVAKPIEIDDGEPHEAHLTGRRALHFCRKHIRIRLGKLEYVSAHWRGDPALGIKQQRYSVVP